MASAACGKSSLLNILSEDIGNKKWIQALCSVIRMEPLETARDEERK